MKKLEEFEKAQAEMLKEIEKSKMLKANAQKEQEEAMMKATMAKQ
jgi:hypothetical protein